MVEERRRLGALAVVGQQCDDQLAFAADQASCFAAGCSAMAASYSAIRGGAQRPPLQHLTTSGGGGGSLPSQRQRFWGGGRVGWGGVGKEGEERLGKVEENGGEWCSDVGAFLWLSF